jgi:hypothetical protein
MTLRETDPLVTAVKAAIHSGDVEALRGLLAANGGLAAAVVTRPGGPGQPETSYPLIAATTDWPGHYPNAADAIVVFANAGAHVDAACTGRHQETALHWAASSDDVEAIDTLLDLGADIEAPGAVIAGGTPLDDAVAFGQWNAARRLVEHGARTALWHAAALGLMDRLQRHFDGGRLPATHPWGRDSHPRDIDVAFWCACHGGQLTAAKFLLEHGANPNWRAPWDGLTPLDTALRAKAEPVVDWLRGLRV